MEIARRSIGSINVILIDDAYPLFEAPRGTFAFNTGGDHFVSNGKIWYRMISDKYGEIYVLGNATNLGRVTVGNWYAHGLAYTEETSNGMTHNGVDALAITDGNPTRVYLNIGMQLLNTGSARWDVETTFALQNDVGSYLNTANIAGGSLSDLGTLERGHVKNSAICVLNPNTNDKIRPGFRVTYRSSTSTFTMPDRKLTAFGFDQSFVLDESYFEGTFADEGWTAINGTETNKWYVLSSGAYSGSGSACISNDGTNQAYTNTSPSIVHLYKDIEIPEFVNGVTISYAWKCAGETNYDYGNVWLAQTAFTPTAGTAITTANAKLLGYSPYSGSSTWNNVTDVTLQGGDLNDYKGKTVRLIFEWINDGSIGTNPGFCIDNVIVYAFVGGDEREFLVNDEFATLGDWTAVQGAQTNYWIAGSAAAGVYQNGGTGAYVTNNGTDAQYTNTSSSVSHIYQDVAFPDEDGDFYVEFMWKCVGETGAGDDQYDFGRIYMLETTDTLNAGSLPLSTRRIGELKYYNQTAWAYEKISLGDVRGTTKRLVLTWNNNGSTGTNPGMCISNLKVYKE